MNNKKWRIFLAPLMLLMLAGTLLCMLLFLQKDESDAPQTSNPADQRSTLFTCKREDLRSITITPPSGESYTLQVQNGALSVPGDKPFPIRSLIAENLLSAVCTVVAEEEVLDTNRKVTDLAAFGLNPPKASAQITCQDGSTHLFRVGDVMPLGIPYRYFMWDDDGKIYAISADVYDILSYDLASLHDVEQPVWDDTLWDKVTLTGENERTLVRTDIGWQMTAPYAYPVDTEKTEQFLSAVENIAFANYVGDAHEVDLDALGLSAPRLTLAITQAASQVHYYDETYTLTNTLVLPEEEITLTFGNAVNEYYVYCRYLDTVYTATVLQTGFLWNQDVTGLLDATPLDVPISALSRLTVRMDGTDTVYDISLTEQLEANGELKTDANGNTLWDVHVQKNGQSMDGDAFLTWYAALQQCAPQNAVPKGYAPEGCLLCVTFEGDTFTREAAFYPLDALHTALSINGSTLYYFANTALSSVLTLP